MLTVGTRQLKQNPAAAIDQVLATGQPAMVTSYGKPTGVVLAPERLVPQRWVDGSRLKAAIANVDDDPELRQLLHEHRHAGPAPEDPWVRVHK